MFQETSHLITYRWVKLGIIDTGELHKLNNICGDKFAFIGGLRFKMYRKGQYNCNCNDYSKILLWKLLPISKAVEKIVAVMKKVVVCLDNYYFFAASVVACKG